jgi:isoamylase
MRVWPGAPYPLGASYDGAGTNFSLFSEVAEAVDLCLFDASGEERRLALPEQTAYCWHGYLPGVRPGQRYGFRVHGPFDPAAGRRCNPAKLLLDPYARAVEGEVRWDPAVYPYPLGGDPAKRDDVDSAPYVPRSLVTDPFFEWGNDRPLRRLWHETIIYELHVKGFTATHPGVPEELRGTYSGLVHPVALDYLEHLGVTAVELLPVHQFIHERELVELGLRNYWGYNSICFLAPHNGYRSFARPAEVVEEFKAMVKALHEAGIEVILDVVYNHTAEGGYLGPCLSFKGIDNAAYYRLDEHDRSRYVDTTSTGNTLNMRQPHVLQLIMDSLRYFAIDCHVDGFRFDLAASLARQFHEVDRLSAFFDLIQCDPVISELKLIAEPWDLGPGGYQVGNFPPRWSEWNARYRDTLRDYWRGARHELGELATRLTGSSDLYEAESRRPYASVNFVTCHDGFTLADLVSYEHKHNEANGHANTDGTDDHRSWNCGVEGPTEDRPVLELRRRQQRNFMATLLLSQGVPMLLGGDEIGRTQRGNNNAYCQDNPISWFDWETVDEGLLEFVRRLVALRLDHPVFHRRRFFHGRPIRGSGLTDIAWFRPDGDQMSDQDWIVDYAKAIGVFLNGDAIPDPGPRGETIRDASFYLIFNAGRQPLWFTLPGEEWGGNWTEELRTGEPSEGPVTGRVRHAGERLLAGALETVLLCREGPAVTA